MKPMQLVLLLATASVSLAAGCPFAKFAKAGGNGPPELDHEKLAKSSLRVKVKVGKQPIHPPVAAVPVYRLSDYAVILM
ncbi:hypothetical protein MYU51_017301 [Penicillium brevicompactum]